MYPERRVELNRYLAIISDLAIAYGGILFYEYHKSFSVKAAFHIQKFNQRLDWSVVDLTLISRHFTGHQALSCAVCGCFSHTASLCPKIGIQHGQPFKVSQKMAEKINVKVTPKSKSSRHRFASTFMKAFADLLIVNLYQLIAETATPGHHHLLQSTSPS